MRQVAGQAALASTARAPVVLIGEPGTGKHWLARTIHFQGITREETFLGLNCSWLPLQMLENLTQPRPQPLGDRACGTLFLKEPHLLPRELQSRIIDSLGSGRSGPRLIAAFSTDPSLELKTGRLAEDFYYSVSTLTIRVLPLRERQVDLEKLTRLMLDRLGHDKAPHSIFSTGAWDVMLAYHWPRNLQELLELIRQTVGTTTSGLIDAANLPAYMRQREASAATVSEQRSLPLSDILQEVEKRLIRIALQESRGNRSRAAGILAIWRARLLRRMAALGIGVSDISVPTKSSETLGHMGSSPKAIE
jgi:DNA-binding NtrC family response regulator